MSKRVKVLVTNHYHKTSTYVLASQPKRTKDLEITHAQYRQAVARLCPKPKPRVIWNDTMGEFISDKCSSSPHFPCCCGKHLPLTWRVGKQEYEPVVRDYYSKIVVLEETQIMRVAIECIELRLGATEYTEKLPHRTGWIEVDICVPQPFGAPGEDVKVECIDTLRLGITAKKESNGSWGWQFDGSIISVEEKGRWYPKNSEEKVELRRRVREVIKVEGVGWLWLKE